MKTITLQGELSKFNNLEQAMSSFDEDRLPYEVETRVYVIDTENLEKHHTELTDDEFQTLAKEQGRVYSLIVFQQAFNYEEVNSFTDVIRFIAVPLF